MNIENRESFLGSGVGRLTTGDELGFFWYHSLGLSEEEALQALKGCYEELITEAAEAGGLVWEMANKIVEAQIPTTALEEIEEAAERYCNARDQERIISEARLFAAYSRALEEMAGKTKAVEAREIDQLEPLELKQIAGTVVFKRGPENSAASRSYYDSLQRRWEEFNEIGLGVFEVTLEMVRAAAQEIRTAEDLSAEESFQLALGDLQEGQAEAIIGELKDFGLQIEKGARSTAAYLSGQGTYREVGSLLEVSEGAAKYQISKTMDQLRKQRREQLTGK